MSGDKFVEPAPDATVEGASKDVTALAENTIVVFDRLLYEGPSHLKQLNNLHQNTFGQGRRCLYPHTKLDDFIRIHFHVEGLSDMAKVTGPRKSTPLVRASADTEYVAKRMRVNEDGDRRAGAEPSQPSGEDRYGRGSSSRGSEPKTYAPPDKPWLEHFYRQKALAGELADPHRQEVAPQPKIAPFDPTNWRQRTGLPPLPSTYGAPAPAPPLTPGYMLQQGPAPPFGAPGFPPVPAYPYQPGRPALPMLAGPPRTTHDPHNVKWWICKCGKRNNSAIHTLCQGTVTELDEARGFTRKFACTATKDSGEVNWGVDVGSQGTSFKKGDRVMLRSGVKGTKDVLEPHEAGTVMVTQNINPTVRVRGPTGNFDDFEATLLIHAKQGTAADTFPPVPGVGEQAVAPAPVEDKPPAPVPQPAPAAPVAPNPGQPTIVIQQPTEPGGTPTILIYPAASSGEGGAGNLAALLASLMNGGGLGNAAAPAAASAAEPAASAAPGVGVNGAGAPAEADPVPESPTAEPDKVVADPAPVVAEVSASNGA
mmetsp:Transcript_31983/g.71832  ORF Transcript_31983/g.71832 Transcript_31983/m.71832 type:complete len:538 (-) Transcript_31983:266-1879(-)